MREIHIEIPQFESIQELFNTRLNKMPIPNGFNRDMRWWPSFGNRIVCIDKDRYVTERALMIFLNAASKLLWQQYHRQIGNRNDIQDPVQEARRIANSYDPFTRQRSK